ncbi:MAG TPA: O-antigen ligase family protein [Solirubrobacteraceae bacterium]|nr:O-antigen ligase family protein [Solirubrobacteraceae bacterium]
MVALVSPAALATGVLMAARVGIGLAATAALLYAPLIFLNLSLGLALWTPLTFMESLHFPWSGPAVVSVLLLAAWIGTLPATQHARAVVFANQRWVLGSVVLYLLWIALSLSWSESSGIALEGLVEWLIAAVVFIIVATTISNPRYVRAMLWAFVLGGAASVLIGLATTGLKPSPSAILSSTQAEGRLSGGVSDPNYLAAGVVAAAVIAGALFATSRRPAARWVLLVSIVLLTVGEVASESRGGLLAAGGAAIAALILFKRQRLAVGMILAVVMTVGALILVADPGAGQRISKFNGGGTGRTELWTVAWRIASNHPIVGVGLHNFITQEAKYVRQPGVLTSVALIADKPHVVHNQYLEAFTETGIVGFVLLISMMLGFLSCGVRAAKGFDARGQPELATLARAVVVAEVSIYVALFFLSDGPDQRFWILFGIGAAMLGLASRAGQPGDLPTSQPS